MLNLFLFDGEGGEGTSSASEGSSPSTENSSPETADNGVATEQVKKERTFTQTEHEEAIRERVKGANARNAELRQKVDSYSPLVEALKARYGTDEIEVLVDRLNNDESYIEKEAQRRGLSREATKTMLEVEREKAKLDKARKELEWQNKVQKWRGEEIQTKEKFPNFSLDEEFENPKFRAMLDSGVDVESAYVALHKDGIVQGSLQYAMERGMKIQADNIRANQSRPTENGISTNAAINTTKKIADMTDAEFDEFSKRIKNSIGGNYIRP